MKIGAYILILLSFLLVVQISFVDVLFPTFLVPAVIFASLVVWTLTLGFRSALWYIIPLLILYELLTAGEVRLLGAYAVLLSYGVSFLSRRMLIDNVALSTIFYTAIIMFGALFYHGVVGLIFTTLRYKVTLGEFFFEYLITFIIFVLVRKILIAFQLSIERLRSDRALMIR